MSRTSKTKILSSDLAASQQILITVPGYLQDLQWDTRTEATHVKISVAQARRDPFARHHLPAEFVNREEAQEGKEGEDKKGKKTKRGREEEEENGVEEQQGEMIEFVKLSNYVKLPWCTPPVEEVVIRGLVKTLYIKQKSKIGVTAWQVLCAIMNECAFYRNTPCYWAGVTNQLGSVEFNVTLSYNPHKLSPKKMKLALLAVKRKTQD